MPIDTPSTVPNADALPDEPSTPPEFRAEAVDAFVTMIKASGKTAYLMPTSCELYVRQHLGPFEPERTAVVEALRRGVPDRISKHSGGSGYKDYLKEEADKLAAAAQISPGLAWGAVECWAAGIGKPVGSAAPRVVARSLEVEKPKPTGPDEKLVMAMAAIVAAGGFVGGFFGNGISMFVHVITSVAVESASSDGKAPSTGEVVAIGVLLVLMAIGGIAGGLGAGLGWLMGRGDERPWIGFAAACSTAFVTGAISSSRFGMILSTIFIIVAAFGVSYKAASSGGYRT